MKNKRILMVLILALCFPFIQAQNSEKKLDDKGRLTLTAWIPDQVENMPVAAKKNLENKLSQMVSEFGIAGGENNRFIISANVVVMTKDITPSAPPMQALTLQITFYIGDGFEGKSFSSYSTTAKGVGENETKAYNMALKNVNTKDPGFQTFVEKGKKKILEYFNSQCDFIIKGAQTLDGQNKFDEAIWTLTSVPDACADCWNKCMSAVKPMFQHKIDWECKSKFSEANNIWSANQNYEAANAAAAILSTIDPEAACFKDIKPFADKMTKRVLEVDKREWNYKVEKDINLERDRIKAIRDIGVAYGNGQPKSINVTYKTLW